MLNLKNGNKLGAILIFCALSFLAGAINGFVGTGGGILIIFLLKVMTKNEQKSNLATALFSIIPISLVGSFAYFKAGSVDFSILSVVSLPALFGGILGAFLMDKLRVKFLDLILGSLVVYSGINMIVR